MAGGQISGAVAGGTLNVNSEDASETGVTVASDGLNVFVTGLTNDRVYRYSMSTAWDLSTATYASDFMSTQTNPQCCRLSPDGTKIIVYSKFITARLYQYDLSTPWDLSTASLGTTATLTSETESLIGPFDVNDIGTKLFVGGGGLTGGISVFALSTAWDLSTLTFEGQVTEELGRTRVSGIGFSQDGTEMVTGFSDHDATEIHQYGLSVPYDPATARLRSTLAVASFYTFVYQSELGKIYTMDRAGNRVQEYDVSGLTPDMPTVLTPGDGVFAALTDGVDFTYVYNADSTPSVQVGYALARRPIDLSLTTRKLSTGDIEWWDGAAWVGTETNVVGTAQPISVSDWPALSDTYEYSLASSDVEGIGIYSAWRLLNPYEWWNGSAWVQMTPGSIPSGTEQVTITPLENAFEPGTYEWTVATSDDQSAGPFAAWGSFVVLGSAASIWTGAAYVDHGVRVSADGVTYNDYTIRIWDGSQWVDY